MKKETVITAIVFFAVGFLAGFIYDNQRKSTLPQSSLATGGPQAQGQMPGGATGSQNATAGGIIPGLPEGHPPIDPEPVIEQLKGEATRNPNDPVPRLKLANFLYDQKHYAQAIEWYQRALELDPKNVNARTDLGTAYFYTGRPEDAVREYQLSLATDPKHEPTLFNMVIVNLEGTHDLAAAQEALERLQKLNPNYPQLDSMRQRLEAARTSIGSTSNPRNTRSSSAPR